MGSEAIVDAAGIASALPSKADIYSNRAQSPSAQTHHHAPGTVVIVDRHDDADTACDNSEKVKEPGAPFEFFSPSLR